jgi:hypothetical protein
MGGEPSAGLRRTRRALVSDLDGDGVGHVRQGLLPSGAAPGKEPAVVLLSTSSSRDATLVT